MKYKGQRTLRISLRTIHIITIVFVSSSAIAGHGIHQGWLFALVASGCGLLMDDFVRYGTKLFHYLQFWVIVPKIFILAYAITYPKHARELFVLAIVIGSLISHAPGKIRQYAFGGRSGPCANKVQS
ncbi:MAG: hypothetical protein HOK97_07830 [Deltaproteobacteria bacterium]|nr:hypothetical protein [Deltaproteobacteria bacterium]